MITTKCVPVFLSLLVTLPLHAALVGSWQFDDPGNPLKATVGSDATVAKGHGSSVIQDGMGEVTVVDGMFEGDKAVAIPYESHLRMLHGVPTDAPRPWTLVMRFYIPDDAPAKHTFFSVYSQNNAADADLFLNGDKKIGGGLFYNQSGNYSTTVSFGAWHTLVVRSGINYQDAWLDGTRVLYTAPRTLSGLRSDLKDKPWLLISADNDNEDNVMHVSSVEVYDELLDERRIKNIPYGNLIGWWEFHPENPTKATIGQDLVTAVSNGTGKGSTPAAGNFTTVSGISGLDGAQQIARSSHYRLTHGLRTDAVPAYTMIMDIRSPADSMGKYRSLIQTNSDNTDDADLFIRSSDNAIGIGAANAWGGYATFGCQADTWYRVTIVCDQNKRTLWVDGVQKRESTTTLESSVYNLQNRPEIILFGDESGEDYPIDVSNVMLFDYPMTDAEVKAYGAVATGTIPNTKNLPSDLPRGEWGMEAGIIEGEIPALQGENLLLAGDEAAAIEMRPGPDGRAAGAVFAPRYSWLTWDRPEESEELRINTYTYVFDMRIPEDQQNWIALYQCNPENSNDAEFFVYPSISGQGADRRGSMGLSGTIGFTHRRVELGKWMRLVISASLGNRYDVYVDGEYWGSTGGAPGTNSGWTPQKILHFFCDNNGEHYGAECSYIAAYDRALAPWEAAALGGVRMLEAPTFPSLTGSSLSSHEVLIGQSVTAAITFEDGPAFALIDFGDGTLLTTDAAVENSAELSHTYPKVGYYTVRACLKQTAEGETTPWQAIGTVTVSKQGVRVILN